MPIRTPAHKQTDPEKAPGVAKLSDYLHIKYPELLKPKKTFDEWIEEPYVQINERWFSRAEMFEVSEIIAAKYAWEEARK